MKWNNKELTRSYAKWHNSNHVYKAPKNTTLYQRRYAAYLLFYLSFHVQSNYSFIVNLNYGQTVFKLCRIYLSFRCLLSLFHCYFLCKSKKFIASILLWVFIYFFSIICTLCLVCLGFESICFTECSSFFLFCNLSACSLFFNVFLFCVVILCQCSALTLYTLYCHCLYISIHSAFYIVFVCPPFIL